MVVCLNIPQKFLTKPQFVNELILTPFSPFDITVNTKYLCKCIFMAHSRVRFSYFPKGVLDNKRGGR